VSRAAVMGGQSLEPGQGDDGRVLGLSVAGDVDQPVVQVDRPQRLRRRPYAIGILVCLCVVTGCIGRDNDLVGELMAPDEAVRRNAAFALGEIKDPRAVAPLITVTGARTSMVRGGYFFRLYRRLVTHRQPAEGISQRLGRFAVSFEAAAHQETRCRSLGRWQSPRL